MIIDSFAVNFKRIVNFFCVLLLIVGAICGSVGLYSFASEFDCAILMGMIGLILGPLVTYLVMVILFAPALLIYNVLLKADKKLDK